MHRRFSVASWQFNRLVAVQSARGRSVGHSRAIARGSCYSLDRVDAHAGRKIDGEALCKYIDGSFRDAVRNRVFALDVVETICFGRTRQKREGEREERGKEKEKEKERREKRKAI